MCIEKDHPKISVRRQCQKLSPARSNLYCTPKGESAGNLRFMAIIRCPAGGLLLQIRREGQAVS
ncbi:hypothetical protein [Leisingera sp. M523]|uniref:hypothetical protein n=1 Tax=Leisingera sp. M523 TaxID=2867013 RepID=UPI0021A5FF1D|nr:hypothetical protein [Leisingera sp. M523]UWQ28318.1 hypothetical protein K3557_16345 [Leisingera sp. M523]